MKNLLSSFLASMYARRDAAGGVEGRERFLVDQLGPEPQAFDPGASEEHAQIARDLALEPEIREVEDDVRRAEDLVPSIGTPSRYAVGLFIVAVVELWGSLLVVRAIGISSEYRVLTALGLTIAILYLTHRLAESSAPPPKGASLGARLLHAVKRILIPIVYSLVVIAIAAVRSGAEDTSVDNVSIAEGVLMIVMTAGPAWFAAYLESRRAPAAELGKRLSTLRGRLRALRNRFETARAYVRNLERARGVWRERAARLDARYSVHHELATAKRRAS
jgi:hypothetical protein